MQTLYKLPLAWSSGANHALPAWFAPLLFLSVLYVCSVCEQVFRLCPLVTTDPARTGTRVEDSTVF